LSRTQVVRWAIAASIIGIALIATAAWHGPSLDQVAFDLSRTTAETAGTAAKLSRPAESVAQMAVRSAMTTWEAARTLARPLDSVRPLAQLVLAWVAAGMIGFSTFVIGRDFRLLARHKEQA
jgi:predicted signal transduction protein with EAL and GGDEF domain